MKPIAAFIKKEILELIRTGRLLILTILFILFGIMNPAIAKLTPWLMKMMSESLSETGLILTEININAMTSWTQFYKNIPIALLIFLLLVSSTLTSEYQKGTLINIITKGLARWKIFISKTLVIFLLWTIEFWLCFWITYGYNNYFWDNKIASHLFFSAFCYYLAGIWFISLLFLMSALFQTNSIVLLISGAVFLLFYFASFFSDIKKYLPVTLLNSSYLLAGNNNISEYSFAIIFTLLLLIINIGVGIIIFNKREIK